MIGILKLDLHRGVLLPLNYGHDALIFLTDAFV